MLIPYPEALRITLAQTFTWGTERLPLLPTAQLVHRVLTEPVLTDRPQPPFDRVTMDGIAINHQPYAAGQRVFSVAGIVAAGAAPQSLSDPATCLEVMTGAVRPEGTTTIIRYEDLTRTEDGFRLPEGVLDTKNIHWEGSDAPLGAELLPPGSVIDGATINLLASCGYDKVSVKKLPRVAVVATGDELVDVAQIPLPHQIRRSNVYQLQFLLRTVGINASTHHLADDKTVLRRAIVELLADHDVLIFSGGVSKGRYDFLPEILADLGVEKLFHRVAQRPGKPLWVGRTERTMVFGLPGNPVSGAVGLLAYVGPWLRKNLGLAQVNQARTLGATVKFGKALTLFRLVKIDPVTQTVAPIPNAGSGDASSMLRADGLVVLPAGQDTFTVGQRFPFIGLNSLL